MKVSLRIALIVLIAVLLYISGLRYRISVAQQQLPDLIITSAWQDNDLICYTLKNIGDVGIGGAKAPITFYNYLFIDGNKLAIDKITLPLEAGQEIKRCFDYKFQMTPPQHTITVCADWQQNINESNEKNNCWEQVWTLDESLPDLIVDKIECGSGNKLSITVKNDGDGSLPVNWSALGEIFFNDQSKGIFSLTNATSTFGGGIAEPGGSSAYLLSWDILAPTVVRCAIDIMNDIDEYNEQNNIREENVTPTLTGCPVGCNCLTLDEAKEQGYSLYCDSTQTLCGYDNSGTPKYCWVKVLPPPDLIIRGVRLNILGGGEYAVEYTIANWGHGDAPASVSALYVDDTLVAEESITSLVSAEERDEVFSWHFNSALCTPPSDIIRVVVDCRETIDESYEDNNEGSITWECTESPPPDLRIRRTWTVPLGTGEHQIGYEIENIGTGPSPASTTGLYVDDTLVAEDSVGPLAPMERADRIFTYIYDLSSCSGVNDTLTIYVDDNREIAETDERNNSDTLTWSCPRRSEPDLVIHSVWWESEPASLQNLTLHYSIENRSVTASRASITKLWINGTLVATSSVPALAGGETRGMITFSDRWTPQINANHIRISADADDVIEEGLTGEMNNSLETDWVFDLNCYNRFQDRDETGIDCGGSHCPLCDRCEMATLPARWDWRDYYTLPAIRDQQSCGSCWAHAALGAMEGTYAINTGLIIDLSEQYAICDVPGDCDGGCPHDVFRHARSTGIIDESCQTYLAANGPCTKCGDWRDRLWMIADYERVSSSINAIKRALICYGPLSVCSENWLHCIVIVGYDDSRNCWIIRNSWGLGWGDDLDGNGWPDDPGYGSIPYTGNSHSDVRDYVHYVIGVMAP